MQNYHGVLTSQLSVISEKLRRGSNMLIILSETLWAYHSIETGGLLKQESDKNTLWDKHMLQIDDVHGKW